MAKLTSKRLATFLAYALHDDIAEGGPNKLNLTNIHHSDYAPNVISVESMTGEHFTITINHFTITINKGYVG